MRSDFEIDFRIVLGGARPEHVVSYSVQFEAAGMRLSFDAGSRNCRYRFFAEDSWHSLGDDLALAATAEAAIVRSRGQPGHDQCHPNR